MNRPDASLVAPPPPLPTAALRRRSPWAIQRAVVFALFIRDLRARVEGRWLGLIWAVAEPALHMLALLLLFAVFRHRGHGGLDPALFLVSGLVPFFLFRNLALQGADAAQRNQGLFSFRQVKPFDTLLSTVMLETVLYSAIYLLILGGLAWSGATVLPARPLDLMASSAVLLALGLGLGLLLMVVCHGRPKLRRVAGLVFLPLYMLSGVVFPFEKLPGDWLSLLLLNPVLHLVELSRHGFGAGYRMVDGVSLAYPAAWALALCTLAMSLYRVQRRRLGPKP